MKPAIGKHAYTIQTAIELVKQRNELYKIDVDDGKIKIPDLHA